MKSHLAWGSAPLGWAPAVRSGLLVALERGRAGRGSCQEQG